MTGLEPRSPQAGITSEQHGAHGGHRWMMMACCVPMLLIAVALVVSGVANAGAIFFAVACTAMMALMMVGMGHGADN
jgi:hypothetical protein